MSAFINAFFQGVQTGILLDEKRRQRKQEKELAEIGELLASIYSADSETGELDMLMSELSQFAGVSSMGAFGSSETVGDLGEEGQAERRGRIFGQNGFLDTLLGRTELDAIHKKPALPEAEDETLGRNEVRMPNLERAMKVARTGDRRFDIAWEDASPLQRAFLNATAVGESGGRYDVRYTPQGGAAFPETDQHPRVFEQGPAGPSSAAGRYQFVWSTWRDRYGGDSTPFTRINQDMAAWDYGVHKYKAATGRDLKADLEKKGMSDSIMNALGPSWAAFNVTDNRANIRSVFDESLTHYRPQPLGGSHMSTGAPVSALPTT